MEARGYYIDQFCQRLGDETATLAWKGALEACVASNSGNWVQWGTLFDLWKTTMVGREDLVDPGDLLRTSDTLKKFVGRSPKTEPLDRENPDTPWEYDCESRVTKILRAVTIARRNIQATTEVDNLKNVRKDEV